MRMAVELAEHRFSVRCGDGAKARPSGTCVFYLHGYSSVTLVVEFQDQGFTSHTQRPRMDLNKKSLPRPKTATA